LVSRYFGGTKLGTGGLIRAYSECAESAISNVNIIKQFNFIKLSVRYPFDLSSKIQRLLHKYNIKIKQTAGDEGMKGKIEVLPSQIAVFKSELLAAGGGRVHIKDS
jgi:putative IMPACT (imprinted ancient) family translation regulator